MQTKWEHTVFTSVSITPITIYSKQQEQMKKRNTRSKVKR